MIITALTIENFKGIREPVRIDFKPITLLFGPNSVGKSTIIQALHYAREIFERRNLNPDQTLLGGALIDLGGFASLVHKHDLSLPIVIRFDLDFSTADIPEYLFTYFKLDDNEDFLDYCNGFGSDGWVEISIKWSEILGEPIVNRYEVGFDNETLAVISSSLDAKQVGISYLNSQHSLFTEIEKDSVITIPRLIEDIVKEKILKIAVAPFNAAHQELTSELHKDLKEIDQKHPREKDSADETYNRVTEILLGQGIGVLGLDSALPNWGFPLHFQSEAFNIGEEDGDDGSNAYYSVLIDQILNALILGSGEILRDELKNFNYLGPLREIPSRNYTPSLSPNPSRWASGIGAWDVIAEQDEKFIDKVNEWLSRDEKLNTGYRLNRSKFKEISWELLNSLGQIETTAEDYQSIFELTPVKTRINLIDEKNNLEVFPQDIGVGISQVLPVIVLALYSDHGIVSIEQPELHVHPAFQVAMGDLFISQINEKPDLTFLIETHSEHLMLRFIRRIRETSEGELSPGAPSLKPGQISVNYLSADPSDKNQEGKKGMKKRTLRLDETGEFIDRWPKGFFEERADELF